MGEDTHNHQRLNDGGGAEALDAGDGTGMSFAAFVSRLFEQKAGNDAMDDL